MKIIAEYEFPDGSDITTIAKILNHVTQMHVDGNFDGDVDFVKVTTPLVEQSNELQFGFRPEWYATKEQLEKNNLSNLP